MGTAEGQDYAGLLQGLDKVADVSVFKTPTGHYGQLDALGKNQEHERKLNGEILLRLATDPIRGTPIFDLIIGQMWAYRMDVSALDHLGALNIPIVNISMDDRHAYWRNRTANSSWDGTHGLIGHIDLACTAAPEAVNWYHVEGCPAIFLPEASDPDFFRPYPELPKLYDVCFVGLRYGIRDQIVKALKNAGLVVRTFGHGWPDDHLPAKDVPRLFAQSRIVLGIGTIDYCKDFFALKMRDFDGPMSGSFYLTHANPDLNLVYDVGKEIVVYRNPAECVTLAKYYCEHEIERELIAQRGRNRAEMEHTWADRFRLIFTKLQCLSEKSNLQSN